MTETKPLTTTDVNRQTGNPATAAATTTAEAQIAKSNEQREAILAENKEREKWNPTPTQEENDKAAMGMGIADKKPDGSPIEPTAEQQQQEQQEKQRKQIEASRSQGSKANYQTRSSSAS